MITPGFLHPAWQALAERYPGHHFLDIDPLYALDSKLTNDLEGLLLTPAEVTFEKDLAELSSGGGFFHRTPFADPLTQPPQSQETRGERKEVDEEQTVSDRGKSVHDPLFEPFPLWEGTVEGDLSDQHDYVLRRQRAYTSWLVCNEQFRTERDALCRTWGCSVDSYGFFPKTPSPLLGEGHSGRSPFEPFIAFYHRWGLSTFLTWDLPVPALPELRSGTPHLTVNYPASGLTIFVPWYLFRDKQLDLHEIVRQLHLSRSCEHLAAWLANSSKDDARFGYARLEYMFLLYRYWHLALSSRYGSQLKKKTERLDHVFGQYLGVSVENVRKVRQELAKQLP